MPKFENTKTICADTNILIGLAAKMQPILRDIHVPENFQQLVQRNELNKNLEFLQQNLRSGKLKLVVLPVVLDELIYLNMPKNINIETMTNKEKKQLHLVRLKLNALDFLLKNSSIKIITIEDLKRKEFNAKTKSLAELYCKDSNPVFDRINGFLPNDARIMAQASILGLEVLSMDKHFVYNGPGLSNPKLITKLNRKFFNQHLVPSAVSFNSLYEKMFYTTSGKAKEVFPVYQCNFSYTSRNFSDSTEKQKLLKYFHLEEIEQFLPNNSALRRVLVEETAQNPSAAIIHSAQKIEPAPVM